MGYTHYWYRPVGSKVDPAIWRSICNDARKLIAAADYPVVYGYDQPNRPAEANGYHIWFNGAGDAGHETFYFPRITEEQSAWRQGEPEVFSFCKTARKPYDDLVCALLAILAERIPEQIEVSSDGSACEWTPALSWASGVLGRTLTLPKQID